MVEINDKSRAVKCHYLDTSALIKILVDDSDEEEGRANLRKYFNSESSFYTTSFCFSETIGILKKKYFDKKKAEQGIEEKYIKAIRNLVFNKINIDDVEIGKPEIFKEATRFVKKHNIDFTDAMELVTVMRGTFSCLINGSKSILITADSKLAEAARAEDARVWDCIKELKPE